MSFVFWEKSCAFTKVVVEMDFGSETFGTLLLIGCWKQNASLLTAHRLIEAKRFASFTLITKYILRAWKRDVSLPTAHWFLEAKRFASFTLLNNYILWPWKRSVLLPLAISNGSRRFRFHAHNNRTHDTLPKKHMFEGIISPDI